MLTIRLTFLAARYHATGWGRHVNEGVPEWPPSPYRLVRALYDVWQRKAYDLAEDDVRVVLEAIASEPPRFYLPPAVAAHTRSYLSANKMDPTDKNLVFDPFLVFDRGHKCYVSWPGVDLAAERAATLDRLLENLNYLGRSESWVRVQRWDGVPEGELICDPMDRSEQAGYPESVACPVPAVEFQGKGSWLDALTFSTGELIKKKVSEPPAMQYVRYIRPEGAILTDPVRRPDRRMPQVDCILVGLDSTVLPLVTSTLEVAEQIRVRLMGAHRRRMDNDGSRVSPIFSGKSRDGIRNQDHEHVYILPLAGREARRATRIDRVLICSRRRPFKRDELDAIGGLRELWQSDGRPKVRCVVTWQGVFQEVKERSMSRTVQNVTPFVCSRHWRKGRNFDAFLEEELRRECRNHHINGELERVEADVLPGQFDLVEYRRNRKDDPIRPGYAVRLVFAEPVPTPFAIGYGAHFGLGLFQPRVE